MNKKYIQAKIGLLIGLLSCSTFLSCVHTRQTLGVEPSSNKLQNSVEDGPLYLEISNNGSSHCLVRLARKVGWFCVPAGFLTMAIGCPWVLMQWLMTHGSEKSSYTPKLLIRNTSAPFMLTESTAQINSSTNTPTTGRPYNITVSQEKFIFNTTTEDPGSLVPNGKPFGNATLDACKDRNATYGPSCPAPTHECGLYQKGLQALRGIMAEKAFLPSVLRKFITKK